MTLTLWPPEEARAEALSHSAGDLEASWGEGALSARRAELLRSCVWALTRQASEPVRTLRVTNLALELSLAHCPSENPEEERECLRETLEELGLIGDLTSLKGGLWLPSPARTVGLPGDATDSLLVGGPPTLLFPEALRAAVRCHGTMRRLTLRGTTETDLGDFLRAIGAVEEPFEAWSCAPPVALVTWGEGVMASALLPFAATAESRSRAYVPRTPTKVGATPRSQLSKWVDLSPQVEPGRYLVRIERAGEYRDDFVVAQVRHGQAQGVSQVLQGGDHRRLMYYLDGLAQEPTRAKVKTQGNGRVALELSSELPRHEVRVISAYAVLLPNENGGYYPRTWLLAEGDLPAVIEPLNKLGITVLQPRA